MRKSFRENCAKYCQNIAEQSELLLFVWCLIMLRSWTSEHFWSDPRSQSIFDYSVSRNNVFCDSGLLHDTRHIKGVSGNVFWTIVFDLRQFSALWKRSAAQRNAYKFWLSSSDDAIALQLDPKVMSDVFRGKVDVHVLSAGLPWSSGEVFCFTSLTWMPLEFHGSARTKATLQIHLSERGWSHTKPREWTRWRRQTRAAFSRQRCLCKTSSSCSAGAKLVNGGHPLTWLFWDFIDISRPHFYRFARSSVWYQSVSCRRRVQDCARSSGHTHFWNEGRSAVFRCCKWDRGTANMAGVFTWLPEKLLKVISAGAERPLVFFTSLRLFPSTAKGQFLG